MKRQRSDEQSDEQGATPGTASETLSMPPAEPNSAVLPMILSTLETIQATMAAMRKEVADIKETQLAIISSQRHLSNQVLDLQNHKKKFFTRVQDIPVEVIVQIFAWIPMRTVLHYRRLSKTINQCLMSREFAMLNVQTTDFQKGLENGIDRTWFHLPEPYQTVFASAMSEQLKKVGSNFKNNEMKPLPQSITRLTGVEKIELPCCKLTGSIPDGISALQNLTTLQLSHNSLTGPLPSSLNLLVALESLVLTNNQLCGEFPALPNLHELISVDISANRFTGPFPTVFGNSRALKHLFGSKNLFSVIPATISLLTNLEQLDISENSFTCELPAGIWNLTALSSLNMSNCRLSGSLAGVGALHNLESLDAFNNQFSGELPSLEIRTLGRLIDLHLSRNQLSGGEMLDMTGSNLRYVCVDPDLQRNMIVQDCYMNRCRHAGIGDY
ncbi:hypothetical protein CcCBS67573_g10301 [Chytriomyces confervae]|uniref:F-box domain-containing protein n=1 Tax=Chytriomyces confervae TaxID=246404 RepID=A0A507D5F9_9FUNG|nr:hypothetical protein CcCBS67573_g10301 [Chytriomyces confervae]